MREFNVNDDEFVSEMFEKLSELWGMLFISEGGDNKKEMMGMLNLMYPGKVDTRSEQEKIIDFAFFFSGRLAYILINTCLKPLNEILEEHGLEEVSTFDILSGYIQDRREFFEAKNENG